MRANGRIPIYNHWSLAGPPAAPVVTTAAAPARVTDQLYWAYSAVTNFQQKFSWIDFAKSLFLHLNQIVKHPSLKIDIGFIIQTCSIIKTMIRKLVLGQLLVSRRHLSSLAVWLPQYCVRSVNPSRVSHSRAPLDRRVAVCWSVSGYTSKPSATPTQTTLHIAN